jgi:hypothetical protein
MNDAPRYFDRIPFASTAQRSYFAGTSEQMKPDIRESRHTRQCNGEKAYASSREANSIVSKIPVFVSIRRRRGGPYSERGKPQRQS